MLAFLLIARWTQEHWGWGSWIFWVCLVCGLITSWVGVRDTILAMQQGEPQKESKSPPVFFNDHT